jgi:LacI family transcriptional regulator
MSGSSDFDQDRRERPTMRDVAALAGVGLKTVSRVVNDVPTVAPDLAERVRAAAEKLGYRPNLTASNLRRGDGRTNTVGLLVEDVSNPFSSAIHRAVEDLARKRGVLLLTGSLDEDPARERELAKILIDRRVDGLIIVPAGHDHRYVVAEQQTGTAFVFIDRLPSPLVADAVVTDHRLGSEKGVTHLLRTGRTNICYLGDVLTIPTARERFAGYEDALAAARLSPQTSLVRHGLRTTEQARQAARDLLAAASPPEAIFASQNLVTIGVIEALHELGMHEQVALVGFDDVPLAAALHPGITVIAQNPMDIGRLAAERLFARIDGDRSPPMVHTVPSRLIIRGSGELPAVR